MQRSASRTVGNKHQSQTGSATRGAARSTSPGSQALDQTGRNAAGIRITRETRDHRELGRLTHGTRR